MGIIRAWTRVGMECRWELYTGLWGWIQKSQELGRYRHEKGRWVIIGFQYGKLGQYFNEARKGNIFEEKDNELSFGCDYSFTPLICVDIYDVQEILLGLGYTD